MSIIHHYGIAYPTCSRDREFREDCKACVANRAVYLCVKENILCSFCLAEQDRLNKEKEIQTR